MRTFLLVACSGTDGVEIPAGPTGGTGAPPSEVTVDLGPVAILTDPPENGIHHHATLAWAADSFAVAFVVNGEPDTQAWVQRFDAGLAPASEAVHLNATTSARGDKPDIEWDGDRFVVAWDDGAGGIWLAGLSSAGLLSAPLRLHDTDLDTEAVDLALQPGGAGTAIWTEAGGPGMEIDEGRIVWRAFDAALAPSGDAVIVEESSKKAADAAPLEDGGWVGVWAIHGPHPTIPDELAYEVRGARFDAAGLPAAFRADDAEASWPSRPAVAVGPLGTFAVSWRDKTASRGESAGAFGRQFAANATAATPSIALGPGGDGDRVVVAYAGDHVVFAWQETLGDGLHGVVLSVVGPDGAIEVDRLALSESGPPADERPSIAVRAVEGGHEVLAVWETFDASGRAEGLRGRLVAVTSSR